MNDADRLGRDPAMRWIVGGKAIERQAASTSQMGRFETELATDENVEALVDNPPKMIILDPWRTRGNSVQWSLRLYLLNIGEMFPAPR